MTTTLTYSEEFPPGTRVKVHAFNPNIGSDHEWHGHFGVVMKVHGNQWAEIMMEKSKRGWPNPAFIGCDCLRAAAPTSTKGASVGESRGSVRPARPPRT